MFALDHSPLRTCHPERSRAVSAANRQTQSKDPVLACAISGPERSSCRITGVITRLTVFLVFSVPFLCARTSGELTGSSSDIVSPDGRYALHNIDDYKHFQHSVFLKDRRTGSSQKVYEYGRSAGALWSPDSRHFAINDHAGSDYTETKILSVDKSDPDIDVQKEVRDKYDDVPGGHHEYFYVAYWIDSRRVVVYHWGYGGEDPNGFCNCYVYRLNGPVHKCARQPKDSDSVCSQTTP